MMLKPYVLFVYVVLMCTCTVAHVTLHFALKIRQ